MLSRRMGLVRLGFASVLVLACQADKHDPQCALQTDLEQPAGTEAQQSYKEFLDFLSDESDGALDFPPMPNPEERAALKKQYDEASKKITLRSELMSRWDALAEWVGLNILANIPYAWLSDNMQNGRLIPEKMDELTETLKGGIDSEGLELSEDQKDMLHEKVVFLQMWLPVYFEMGTRSSADFRARAMILHDISDAQAAVSLFKKIVAALKHNALDEAFPDLAQVSAMFKNDAIYSADVDEKWRAVLERANDPKVGAALILKKHPNFGCVWAGTAACKRMEGEYCIGAKEGEMPNREGAEYNMLGAIGGCSSSKRKGICQCKPAENLAKPLPSWAPSSIFFPGRLLQDGKTRSCVGSPDVPSITISGYVCKFAAEWNPPLPTAQPADLPLLSIDLSKRKKKQ